MEAVILVIHLIVALSIIAVVLVQPSEAGGFLGSSGSMSNMMAPRRSGDALTRLTTILAGVFFLTSLSLAIIAEHGSAAKKSILDVATTDQPAATKGAPVVPKAAAPKKVKPTAPISR
ncbi:MAG: preprotein translocase subunit SecG [Proteobacteria bacterium]|nr:preprotein translocase subunit SecG [Pseudomonadota bacterium]